MFELTESAAKAIRIAKEFSLSHNYPYIGTEHILYGLIAEEQGLAATILKEQEIDIDFVEEEIIKMDGVMNTILDDEEIDFTPRTKRIMINSKREANRMGQNQVGSEHILLSLMREIDSAAVKILIDADVDPQQIFTDILRIISDESPISNNSSNASSESNARINAPTLRQYGKDLTELAEKDMLDPVVGREYEIERVIEILCRRNKNNPVLIGEPGVGKTAIVEGIAQKIVLEDVPEMLKNNKIFCLDISSIVAGAKYRGEFEERLKRIVNEVNKLDNVILFIDELHTIVGAGAGEGTMDAANILKPMLSRGEVQIIGATTIVEYRKHIEKDSALDRRFQSVVVAEPDIQHSIDIINGLKAKYEAHHGVKISDEAIKEAVNLSVRFIPDKFLPDKAIDLIDEACSKARIKKVSKPKKYVNIEKELNNIIKKKEEAITLQDFEKAAQIRDEEKRLKKELESQRAKLNKQGKKNIITITSDDITGIVSQITKIPVTNLTQTEMQRIKQLDIELKKKVIGQDEAIDVLSKAIKRSRVGLKDINRPIGSFIFLGPTGVGKTELTKTLALTMFGNESSMIRLDMSEYMESHSVSKLIGAPPGYKGFEDGGQLTEKVRLNPYSIILFDEIEKAHPDVFNILLQILDDGRLTDSSGRTVNFKNTIIILTSNVGANNIVDNKVIGFVNKEDKEKSYERNKQNVMNELKKTFKPEFINRLDDIIVFKKLDKEAISKITRIMIDEVAKKLKERNISIEISDNVVEYISNVGYDASYGARPLRRTIQSKIEDYLAEAILDEKIIDGDKIKLYMELDKLKIEKK